MRTSSLGALCALAALGCDPRPPPADPGTTGDGHSGGSSATSTTLVSTTEAPGSSEDAVDSTTTFGGSTGVDLGDASTGDPLLDLGSPPPAQMCHALPPPVGAGPVPLWCDEWIPEGEDQARGRRVAVGPTGEIYVTGKGTVVDSSDRGWLARYSPEGVRLWSASFSYGGLAYDDAVGVAVAPGGDVLVGGEALYGPFQQHGWLARLSPDGDPIWALEQPDLRTAWRIGASPDGTFVVVGSGPYFGGAQPPARVTRHEADGSLLWLYDPHGPRNWSENLIRDVAFDAAGNVYVAGSLSDHTRLVAKLDPAGGVVWALALPYDGSSINVAAALDVTAAGDVLVSGHIDHGAWVARFTTDGASVWDDIVAPGDGFDSGSGLAVLPNGDVVVAGHRSDDARVLSIWLRRYTADGDLSWDYVVPATGVLGADAADVAVTPEGDIVVAGTIHHDAVSYLWLARFVP